MDYGRRVSGWSKRCKRGPQGISGTIHKGCLQICQDLEPSTFHLTCQYCLFTRLGNTLSPYPSVVQLSLMDHPSGFNRAPLTLAAPLLLRFMADDLRGAVAIPLLIQRCNDGGFQQRCKHICSPCHVDRSAQEIALKHESPVQTWNASGHIVLLH